MGGWGVGGGGGSANCKVVLLGIPPGQKLFKHQARGRNVFRICLDVQLTMKSISYHIFRINTEYQGSQEVKLSEEHL